MVHSALMSHQSAQRRPESSSGDNAPNAPARRIDPLALNEGRSLAPATTRQRSSAGYGLGSLNEGRSLAPATTCTSDRIDGKRATALNEGRSLAPATTDSASSRTARGCSAQRRPESSSGDNRLAMPPTIKPPPPLNEGRSLAPATTGSNPPDTSASPTLNEGRSLAPATTFLCRK